MFCRTSAVEYLLGGSDLNETLMVSDFYQHPDLYDALLPVGAHLSFYAALAGQHPEGVLELACGTGQPPCPSRGSVSPSWV